MLFQPINLLLIFSVPFPEHGEGGLFDGGRFLTFWLNWSVNFMERESDSDGFVDGVEFGGT